MENEPELDARGHSDWARRTAQDAEVEVRKLTQDYMAKGVPEPIAKQMAWSYVQDASAARGTILKLVMEAIEKSPEYGMWTSAQRMDFIRKAAKNAAEACMQKIVKDTTKFFSDAEQQVVLELECRFEANTGDS